MGRIVGAFATSHVLMSPDGIEAQAERVFAGMKEIGRRLRAARPDVIVLITSDHLNNFKLDLQVPFIVATASMFTPFGDMGVPKTPFRGYREFAEALIEHAAAHGLDLARAEEARPDHGVAIPVAIVNPNGAIPVVPLYINVAMEPVPAPRRVWALGQALRDTVERHRPAAERVVVLATGGLSHWICMARQGDVNEAFDREVLDRLVRGEGDRLAALTAADILDRAGNGGLEILNWIAMAGAVAGARGETIYYEPIPSWLTGMGGVAMDLGGAA